VVIEAFTDNKQRTVSEIKNLFDKNGGTMGLQGSVMYQFEKKGFLVLEKGERSLDDIFLLVADSGAEDVEDTESELLIYTKPGDLAKVRQFLIGQGINILSAELIYKPSSLITLPKEDIEKALSFIEKMEEQSDVQKVFANFDVTDNI
jgi:transcriptional/translational regulatory protein YebC/TACO1